MGAIAVDERPTDVTPTAVGARKERSDKGKSKLSPEERAAKLNARAEVILADARAAAQDRIRAKAGKLLARAHEALQDAQVLMAPIDAEKAGALETLAMQVDGLELGA